MGQTREEKIKIRVAKEHIIDLENIDMKKLLQILRKQATVKTARGDLRKKISTEKTFKREIDSLFARILKDFRARYAGSGQIMNPEEYQADWQMVLKKHYERVHNAFAGQVLKNATIDEEVISKEDILVSVLLLLLDWRNERAPRQAAIINDTTYSQMRDSVQQALEDTVRLGLPADRASIVALAAVYLNRKIKPRKDSIAIFETQSAAESAKNTEANEIDRMFEESIPAAVFIRKDVKTWVNMGDRRVRPTHEAAGGQTVSLQDPFIVGGSFLMFPGDNSLGAPLEEIINCRCSVVYDIKRILKS